MRTPEERKRWNAYMRAYRKKNPPKKRKRVFTEEQKARRVARGIAWQQKNPERRRKNTKQWRERNPTAGAEATARWRKLHPQEATQSSRNSARSRRAAKRGANGSVSVATIKRIFKLQRGRCAYCQISLKNGFHVDHIQAVSNGGKHVSRNVQLACEPCNLRKGTRDPMEFARSIGRLL